MLMSFLFSSRRRHTRCSGVSWAQAEDGIRDAQESRGLGDVYKRQVVGQAVCDLQAGGGRGVQESAGEPGRAGGGWVHDRGVRVRSAEQIVCDVESDVLGQLLSAAGESRRGAETAR